MVAYRCHLPSFSFSKVVVSSQLKLTLSTFQNKYLTELSLANNPIRTDGFKVCEAALDPCRVHFPAGRVQVEVVLQNVPEPEARFWPWTWKVFQTHSRAVSIWTHQPSRQGQIDAFRLQDVASSLDHWRAGGHLCHRALQGSLAHKKPLPPRTLQ